VRIFNQIKVSTNVTSQARRKSYSLFSFSALLEINFPLRALGPT
jgi:hypothetical protein